jgi:hypothetical protein
MAYTLPWWVPCGNRGRFLLRFVHTLSRLSVTWRDPGVRIPAAQPVRRRAEAHQANRGRHRLPGCRPSVSSAPDRTASRPGRGRVYTTPRGSRARCSPDHDRDRGTLVRQLEQTVSASKIGQPAVHRPLTGLDMPDSVARCPRSPALPSLWRYSPSGDLRRSRPSRQRPSAAGCPPTTPSCWPKAGNSSSTGTSAWIPRKGAFGMACRGVQRREQSGSSRPRWRGRCCSQGKWRSWPPLRIAARQPFDIRARVWWRPGGLVASRVSPFSWRQARR